ncbi:MAG: cellobiose phosphorylase [Lactococcus lactis]|nr:cellobiose phosphorylase [Lactococcus lactis]
MSFLDTGDLYEIEHQGIMVNQLHGNVIDGSLNQIYLRIKEQDSYLFTPLIGSNSPSRLQKCGEGLRWTGTFHQVDYRVDFQIGQDNIWFWTVKLKGYDQTVDIIYGQDIGNATKAAVRSNEAYISQYVDHHVSQHDGEIVISSRQNQPQNGNFPLIEQGSLQALRSFSTDGYQFFGTSYEETNSPKILQKETLANEVYQYEFAYVALQTEALHLNGKTQNVVFYACAQLTYPNAVTQPTVGHERILTSYRLLPEMKNFDQAESITKKIGAPITGNKLQLADLRQLFPTRKQVEVQDGTTLSFFTEHYHHVVLKEKELQMERTHGTILLGGVDLEVAHPVLSTTVYMTGLFNSQTVIGNTDMNKLLSNSRNSLNTMKMPGQRIYLKYDETWHLLTLPSAFKMGLNSATWYYQLADDLLTVQTYTLTDTHEVRTEVKSHSGKKYTFAVTNQFLMNDTEEVPSYRIQHENRLLTVSAKRASITAQVYPALTYYFKTEQDFTLTDERLFSDNFTTQDLTTLVFSKQSQVTYSIQGTLNKEIYQEKITNYVQEDQKFVDYIDGLLNNFELYHDSADVESTNLITRWYTLNMLIHFLSPHGLEQYGGAAWGTRDVSQGPTEYFLAVNQSKVVRSIILHLFENQFNDDGTWPQWFMFDRYEKIRADESHGDVIVWPLKVVADYLEKSGDTGILQETIFYTDRKTLEKTTYSETLLQHLKKIIEYIRNNFLPGTYLSCYGDGDWDDTLQPADDRLKKNMTSSWTVALTYQVLQKLANELQINDATFSKQLNQLVERIKQDYDRYILAEGTLPGFVYMSDNGQPEFMIHPEDTVTGIQYRLLPMISSMTAELLSKKQMQHHLTIIQEQLYFPDGVRLMNQPAHYGGGVSTNFKRAEQSANFGREISLQYVHAHIRFTEAMAKIGNKKETWSALNKVNPIQIQQRVPNAQLRQANAYFSSSDGNFKTRYEAKAEFDKLKSGDVQVKGGWRIYSSGPGIYLNQLITSILGIREKANEIEFDPILPDELDGLQLQFELMGKKVFITYHLNQSNKAIRMGNHTLEWKISDNSYREGGMIVDKQILSEYLKRNKEIEIYC